MKSTHIFILHTKTTATLNLGTIVSISLPLYNYIIILHEVTCVTSQLVQLKIHLYFQIELYHAQDVFERMDEG